MYSPRSENKLRRGIDAVMNSYVINDNGNTATEHSTRIRRGIQAEAEVLELLESHGRTCEKQIHQCPFDILVDGWRIDVKTAYPKPAPTGRTWLFNFHHSGLRITECDFFVLRLLSAESAEVDHCLLRAPYHAATYRIHSGRMTRFAMAKEFDLFLRGKYGAGPAKSFKLEGLLPEVDDARNSVCAF